VLGRQRFLPSEIELQAASRALAVMRPYVDTLLASEIVTQLSSFSTVWNPEQEDEAVEVAEEPAPVEVAFSAYAVGVVKS
jgi:hypothetical protein